MSAPKSLEGVALPPTELAYALAVQLSPSPIREGAPGENGWDLVESQTLTDCLEGIELILDDALDVYSQHKLAPARILLSIAYKRLDELRAQVSAPAAAVPKERP